jgi:hypothetical protein
MELIEGEVTEFVHGKSVGVEALGVFGIVGSDLSQVASEDRHAIRLIVLIVVGLLVLLLESVKQDLFFRADLAKLGDGDSERNGKQGAKQQRSVHW